MTVKKFLNRIKWDTSVCDLKLYANGQKKIPFRSKTVVSKLLLYITNLIPIRQKDNEQFCIDFLQSDLVKMAEIKLKNTGIKITKEAIIDVSFDILNTATKNGQCHLLRSYKEDKNYEIPKVFEDCYKLTKKDLLW